MKRKYQITQIVIVSLLLLTLLFSLAMNPYEDSIPNDFSISSDTATNSKAGPPGTQVTYTITVTKTAAEALTLSVTCSAAGEINCSTGAINLGESDTSTSFSAVVNIPEYAASGDEITSYVTVASGTGESDELILKTIAFIPPTPTETPEPFRRPLIGLDSYSAGSEEITPGNDFTLTLNLHNSGPTLAGNVVVSFESSDFMPLETGGVRTIAEIGAKKTVSITQPMRANFSMWGYDSGSITVSVEYTDLNGVAYSETFNLTINLKTPNYTAPTPTPTPGPAASAQLVVNTYETDIDPLQPGSIFLLTLHINNMGSDTAKKVTMVLGGGVENVQPGADGSTSGGNGMSGGSADLTHFAPLGSSNVLFLDTIQTGMTFDTTVQLIVNVTTTPGAYPFKISFVYENAEGERVVDDQVITLLVYQLPNIGIEFYRDPGILIAGQPVQLPLQITNLGKNTAMLGNMIAISDNAEITENTLMIGALEPGGYYTMDATLWPNVDGPLTITVTVHYTDDFNQSRIVEQNFTMMVEPMPVYEPPAEGDYMDPSMQEGMDTTQTETFWQQVWRFILGMLGLDSGKPQNDDIYLPEEEVIPEQPIVIPGGKG